MFHLWRLSLNQTPPALALALPHSHSWYGSFCSPRYSSGLKFLHQRRFIQSSHIRGFHIGWRAVIFFFFFFLTSASKCNIEPNDVTYATGKRCTLWQCVLCAYQSKLHAKHYSYTLPSAHACAQTPVLYCNAQWFLLKQPRKQLSAGKLQTTSLLLSDSACVYWQCPHPGLLCSTKYYQPRKGRYNCVLFNSTIARLCNRRNWNEVFSDCATNANSEPKGEKAGKLRNLFMVALNSCRGVRSVNNLRTCWKMRRLVSNF